MKFPSEWKNMFQMFQTTKPVMVPTSKWGLPNISSLPILGDKECPCSGLAAQSSDAARRHDAWRSKAKLHSLQQGDHQQSTWNWCLQRTKIVAFFLHMNAIEMWVAHGSTGFQRKGTWQLGNSLPSNPRVGISCSWWWPMRYQPWKPESTNLTSHPRKTKFVRTEKDYGWLRWKYLAMYPLVN